MNGCYLIDSIFFIYLFFCLATKKLDCKVKEKSGEKKYKTKRNGNILYDMSILCSYVTEITICWYPFSWHIFYKPDSTKPDFLVGSIHVLYFILFFLSMVQAHATYWRKLRNCGLEGMGLFLMDLLHEPSPCVLPSG